MYMAHILVVDSDPLILDLAAATLAHDGDRVSRFADPVVAWQTYRTGCQDLELLLLDVTTKRISGFELFKRLVSIGYKGEVLFMTKYSTIADAITTSLGAKSLVQKPFTAEELRLAVGRSLKKPKARRSVAA